MHEAETTYPLDGAVLFKLSPKFGLWRIIVLQEREDKEKGEGGREGRDEEEDETLEYMYWWTNTVLINTHQLQFSKTTTKATYDASNKEGLERIPLDIRIICRLPW